MSIKSGRAPADPDPPTVPSSRLVAALKATGMGAHALSVIYGVPWQSMSKLLKGLPVRRLVLEHVEAVRDGIDTMRSQARMCIGGRIQKGVYLARLRKVAELVQDVEPFLAMSYGHRYMVTGPVKDIVASVHDALRKAGKSLYKLHRSAPEYDKLVFRDAPALLAKFLKKDERDGADSDMRRPEDGVGADVRGEAENKADGASRVPDKGDEGEGRVMDLP